MNQVSTFVGIHYKDFQIKMILQRCMLLDIMYQTNTPTMVSLKKKTCLKSSHSKKTQSIHDDSRSQKEGKYIKVSPVFAVDFSSQGIC